MKSLHPEAGCTTATVWNPYLLFGTKLGKKKKRQRIFIALQEMFFVTVCFYITMYIWELIFVSWDPPGMFITAPIHTA